MAGFYVVRDGGEVAKLSSASLAVPSTTTTTLSAISLDSKTSGAKLQSSSVLQQTSIPTATNAETLQLHSCSLCRRKFTNPSNLLTHMKNYHHVDTERVVEARKAQEVSQPPVPTSRGYSIVSVSSASSSIIPTSAPFADTSKNALADCTPSVTGILTSEQIRQACSLIVEKTIGQFYCTACSLTFNSRENGITHSRRQHLGEKPYTCSCGVRFALAHARNQHKKVCHLGDSGIKAVSSSVPPHAGTIMTDLGSASYNFNNTNTFSTTAAANKTNLPVTFLPPKFVITSRPKNTQPFFYRNTLDDNGVPPKSAENEESGANTESMDECILPERSPECPNSLGGVETETIRDDKNFNHPPVYLKIVEQRNTSIEPSNASMQIDEYIAKDGVLTDRQISFANTMHEKEIVQGKIWYRCKICEQRLTQLMHVKNHIRHLHLKEHFKCYYCDKRFASKNLRDKHRIRNHRGDSKKQNSATIIQSQLFLNQRQTSTAYRTTSEQAGIHPNAVATQIDSYIGRRGDRFECKKCRKQFGSERNLRNHCRQLHFGRSHLCTSCGLYFEQGLNVHREKCINPDLNDIPVPGQETTSSTESSVYSAEVEYLKSIMLQSIQSTAVGGVNVHFQCQLCTSEQFEKKSLAEAHVWIEHIRNGWLLTRRNVDDIYLQFLKAQFSHENSSATNDHVPAGSVKNAVCSKTSHGETWRCDKCPAVFKLYTTLTEHKKLHSSGNQVEDTISFEGCDETEEELPFDPMSLCDNEIYVDESAYEVDDNDTLQFKIVGYDSSTNMDENSMDVDSECIPSIVSVQGSSATTINSNDTTSSSLSKLTQEQLDQLNMKALQFIREKGGQYRCIVCDQVSNLRRKLVDHVRRMHLMGELDDQEEEERTSANADGKLGKNVPDQQHRVYCRYCEEYFESIRLRADHERHCNNRSKKEADTAQLSNNLINMARNVVATPQERALRFVRADKNEYACTICNIQSTTQERVITHIRKIHFGEEDLASKTKGNKSGGKSIVGKSKSKVIGGCHVQKSKGGHGMNLKSIGSSPQKTLLAVRRVLGKPVGNLMRRPQRISSTSSSNHDDDDETANVILESKMTRSKSLASASSNSKGPEQKDDEIQTTSSPRESNNEKNTNNETDVLTPTQVEEVKKMILEWNVGAKYSFSKCKECNMLFTKYANAEIHVKTHLFKSGSSEKSSSNAELSSCVKTTLREGEDTNVLNTSQNLSESPSHTSHNDDEGDDNNDVGSDVGSDGEHENAKAIESSISPRKTREATDNARKKYSQPMPYQCVQCDKRFLQNHHLLLHKRFCKGDKGSDVSSPVDDKVIEQSESGVLTKEQCDAAEAKVETLELEGAADQYRCKVCSMVFRGRYNECVRHVKRMHYGEMAFKCDKCAERFKYRLTWLNHRATCNGTRVVKTSKEGDSKKEDVVQTQLTENLPSSGSTVATNKLYRCKLCEEQIEDKPFIMYHLVSAHHEELQSMGIGASLEMMETMIDYIPSQSKNDESKEDNKNAQKRLKLSATKQEREVKITNVYSLNSDSPSSQVESNVNSATTKDSKDSTSSKKTKRGVKDHHRVIEKPDSSRETTVKVYGNKTKVLQAIPEKGYFLTDDGKMETLYPSFVLLERLQFDGSLPPSVLTAAKQLIEKGGNGKYKCRNCDKPFGSYSGCFKHVCKNHYGQRNMPQQTSSIETTESQPSSVSQTSSKAKTEKKKPQGQGTLKQIELVDLLEIVFNRPAHTSGILTEEEISMAHSLIQTMRKSSKFACAACDVNDNDFERICRHAREVHFGEKNNKSSSIPSISSSSNNHKKTKRVKS